MEPRIPTICVDRTAAPAHSLFNANEWSQQSKPIILSCAAQYGLLLHALESLSGVFRAGVQTCEARLRDLQLHWRTAPWELERARYLVEVPTVHLYVQAFLATVKTLLDLLAQLTSAQGLVLKKVHGFHKKGQCVGGELLEILTKKAAPGRQEAASELRRYLSEQKEIWIDELIRARDNMAHPQRGIYQVMWELELLVAGGELECRRVVAPHLNDQLFDEYARNTIGHVKLASANILRILRTA